MARREHLRIRVHRPVAGVGATRPAGGVARRALAAGVGVTERDVALGLRPRRWRGRIAARRAGDEAVGVGLDEVVGDVEVADLVPDPAAVRALARRLAGDLHPLALPEVVDLRARLQLWLGGPAGVGGAGGEGSRPPPA